jgi:hypothetical protein
MTLLKRAILVVTLLAVGAQTAAAVPLPQATGGFGIAPARRDVIGLPGMALTPTNVVNRTNSNYQVTVFPAILTQELSGAFDFAETPQNLNNSKLVLSATPNRFEVAPGANRPVDLRWNLLPIGKKWIVMGVVFQGVAQGQSGAVHVVTRLLSVNFLRVPGLTNINGDFTGLYAQQFGRRGLRFTSRVKNTGDRFWAPSDGRLEIRDSAGKVAFSAPWTGSVVIPGAQVDFPVDVHQLLPAGRYTATTTMQFGSHRRSTSTAFTLVGPNQLPTPAITIRGFNANGEIGSPTKVSARIISSGTAPASVTVHLFLGNARSLGRGATALATGQVSYSHLAPGAVVKLSRGLGGSLHKGAYRVIATWKDPTGAQHTAEADFTATPARSWLDQIWSFIKEHIVLFIGLLLIALLIAVAYLVRKWRERQRQIEAELAAARAQLRTRREAPAPAEPLRATAPEPQRSSAANGAEDRPPPRERIGRAMPKPPLADAVEQPPLKRAAAKPPAVGAAARPPLAGAVAQPPSAGADAKARPAPSEAQKLAATAEVDALLARLKAKSSPPSDEPPPSPPEREPRPK